jgi:hypothetical protein
MEIKFPNQKEYIKDAVFSPDRKHRYALIRVWNNELPRIMFIGLNPSTANEKENDPTIRRVINFAKGWGFGGVYMCNLFSFVTPYPSELKKAKDNLENDFHLRYYTSISKEVLCAWGAFPEIGERSSQVYKMLKNYSAEFSALQINKNGSPKHPLYVKADIKRVPFTV